MSNSQQDEGSEFDPHGESLKEDLLRGSAILGQPLHDEVMNARRMFFNLTGYLSELAIPSDWDDETIAQYAREAVVALITLRHEIRQCFESVEEETDSTIH